jgi:hypothetical protein
LAGTRLTIDVTVIGDLCDSSRSGHKYAKTLLELAEVGEVEVAIAPQGWRLDVPDGKWKERLDDLITKGVVTYLPQLSYPSEVTFPSNDLIPGNVVKGLSEAWEQVSATPGPSDPQTPPDNKDRLHVETHVADNRDAFLTSDKALLTMCRRLRDEHGFSIEAVTVRDFLASR